MRDHVFGCLNRFFLNLHKNFIKDKKDKIKDMSFVENEYFLSYRSLHTVWHRQCFEQCLQHCQKGFNQGFGPLKISGPDQA